MTGIDTDGDGAADVKAADTSGTVKGALVIDYTAQIVSENGQTYTAATAPLLMTTGAAGYGSQNNSTASTAYAKDGYISIACGNRGKKDIRNGGPQMGSNASAGGKMDSSNYATFDEMAQDYADDVAEIDAGDEYGKNIVSLYNPLNYIGADETEDPVWTRVVMGAVEGDIAMMPSLNLEIAWLNAGVDTVIEWQWDGGHVPSEALGNSLSLYIDTMYGKHVSGVETVKPTAAQAADGTAAEPTGKDLSSWVDTSSITSVDFSLADVLAYRNSGATKAVPGFDVIDHRQENYVFGNEAEDARHWNVFLNEIFQNEAYASVLRELFNTDTH